MELVDRSVPPLPFRFPDASSAAWAAAMLELVLLRAAPLKVVAPAKQFAEVESTRGFSPSANAAPASATPEAMATLNDSPIGAALVITVPALTTIYSRLTADDRTFYLNFYH